MATELEGPIIVKDPRFRAGSKLITTGRAEGAIDMFATLLEEARNKYGESSIETAPVYYEYGNALFRATQVEDAEDVTGDTRSVEATALDEQKETQEGKKPAAVQKKKDGQQEKERKGDNNGEGQEEQNQEGEKSKDDGSGNDQEEQEQSEEDDVELALSMMETSFSILEEYLESDDAKYRDWVQLHQYPRNLLGIGDILSFLERHADAADVYTRALHIRESNLKAYSGKDISLEELRDRRRAVEASILVAEELLSFQDGQDVVTTETKDLLVKSSERVEYAEGYYNKSRDLFQETVLLMGKLAAKNQNSTEFEEEKDNVRYTSILVIALGERLAGIEEEKQQEQSIEPTKKKAKR